MANEEKTSTAEENADVEETTNEETEETSEETPEHTEETNEETEATQEPSQDEEVQKLLQQERERREKAEKRLAEQAYKQREQRREEEPEDDDDKPVTKKDLEQLQQQLTRAQQIEKAEQTASEMADSNSMKELMLEYYNHRITPTGNIKEDMEMAYALANRGKLLRESEEAKRSLASQGNKQRADASSTRKGGASEPQMSDADRGFIESAGMTWNSTNRRYEGKNTWYDPKTDQSGRL